MSCLFIWQKSIKQPCYVDYLDSITKSCLQATSGRGGWPMSVWLTPDLKPVIGGTYFPPEDSMRQRGFRSVLLLLAKKVCFLFY